MTTSDKDRRQARGIGAALALEIKFRSVGDEVGAAQQAQIAETMEGVIENYFGGARVSDVHDLAIQYRDQVLAGSGFVFDPKTHQWEKAR